MFRFICLIAIVAAAVATPRLTHRSHQNGRIINGTDAPLGKYPSQVSYQMYTVHECSASIVNEQWVLTAAHCVDDNSINPDTILAGTVNMKEGGIRHKVVDVVIHEDFDYIYLLHDIAVVRVDPPFIWDDYIKPVTLPAQGQETPGGSNATVIGWGASEDGGSDMYDLQEVDLWIVTDKECKDAHDFYDIYPTNICAYYPGGGKGTCNGDSGSPLFANGYQAGIVSWSEKPCAIAPYPGVYTEVSAYVDWINTNTKIN